MTPMNPHLLQTLAELKSGDVARLIDHTYGRGEFSRMASFGLTPGVSLRMVQNYGTGPVIIHVRGSQVALGRKQASRIWVERDHA